MANFQQTEKIQIKRSNPIFKELDNLCFRSKNLYNTALYRERQIYFGWRFDDNPDKLGYAELEGYKEQAGTLKTHNDYKALPAKVAQQTLKLVEQNIRAYFAALAAYRKDPTKFKSEPKFPNYLGDEKVNRVDGRFIATFTIQALSSVNLKQGKIKLSGTSFELPSRIVKKANKHPNKYLINQVRVVPKKGYYVIEVVYTKKVKVPSSAKESRVAALDLGVNNLGVITFNGKANPVIVNGRILKSINQLYNKLDAKAKSLLKSGIDSSKRIKDLWRRRANKILHYLHCATKAIIKLLKHLKIGTLVIGLNRDWKQNVNLGDRNNQNFVQIPFSTFISQLTYKGLMAGITVLTREESYTSKASALDNDPIPTYVKGEKHTFSGNRNKRGFYKSSDGTMLNADVNGSFNILRKYLAENGVSEKTVSLVSWLKDKLVRPKNLPVNTGAVKIKPAKVNKGNL